jgi:hypothetical protein
MGNSSSHPPPTVPVAWDRCEQALHTWDWGTVLAAWDWSYMISVTEGTLDSALRSDRYGPISMSCAANLSDGLDALRKRHECRDPHCQNLDQFTDRSSRFKGRDSFVTRLKLTIFELVHAMAKARGKYEAETSIPFPPIRYEIDWLPSPMMDDFAWACYHVLYAYDISTQVTAPFGPEEYVYFQVTIWIYANHARAGLPVIWHQFGDFFGQIPWLS